MGLLLNIASPPPPRCLPKDTLTTRTYDVSSLLAFRIRPTLEECMLGVYMALLTVSSGTQGLAVLNSCVRCRCLRLKSGASARHLDAIADRLCTERNPGSFVCVDRSTLVWAGQSCRVIPAPARYRLARTSCSRPVAICLQRRCS
jgi:hypothetical protein